MMLNAGHRTGQDMQGKAMRVGSGVLDGLLGTIFGDFLSHKMQFSPDDHATVNA
jgi:hypothetical protein